ncbi:hypothetical protein OAO34_05935 [Candidatus Poseidoniaceae archaeon]|nr:hypothetical protein [Candidatus Poseidoniaceae archaeon]
MDPNQYYADLMQQGYSSADATHFTQQYYPNFDGSAQGMAMMTPPPPGSMEMGGMVAGGFGAPAGGMAAGGVAAGGAAAAGGGMSMSTIAVVSVLVLGGAGTGGYFLYDYLTEPDFYGEVYWSEMGFGYIFEEDGLSFAFPLYEGGCDEYDGFLEEEFKKSGGICVADMDPDEYSSEDKGDYYKICIDMDGEGEECIKVYPLERGIVMKVDGECNILVGDISNPSGYLDDDDSEMESWLEDWENIAEEIMDDDDAPSCSDTNNLAETSSGGSLDTFAFSDRDAAGDMSDSGGDALVHIMMTSGDGLNWALVSVSIVVNDGASYHCEEADWADADAYCTYTIDDDKYWEVSEEITIGEGNNTNLCDGSNGGCTVDVTITKVGVGEEDSKVISQISAYADVN